MLNLTDFDEIKEKGEILYKTIGTVHCPFLGGKVFFNSHGLEHLKFKRREKVRPTEDQYMRFKLLHLAPEILKSSHTL